MDVYNRFWITKFFGNIQFRDALVWRHLFSYSAILFTLSKPELLFFVQIIEFQHLIYFVHRFGRIIFYIYCYIKLGSVIWILSVNKFYFVSTFIFKSIEILHTNSDSVFNYVIWFRKILIIKYIFDTMKVNIFSTINIFIWTGSKIKKRGFIFYVFFDIFQNTIPVFCFYVPQILIGTFYQVKKVIFHLFDTSILWLLPDVCWVIYGWIHQTFYFASHKLDKLCTPFILYISTSNDFSYVSFFQGYYKR